MLDAVRAGQGHIKNVESTRKIQFLSFLPRSSNFSGRDPSLPLSVAMAVSKTHYYVLRQTIETLHVILHPCSIIQRKEMKIEIEVGYGSAHTSLERADPRPSLSSNTIER